MSAANLILYFTMWALTEILQQNIDRAKEQGCHGAMTYVGGKKENQSRFLYFSLLYFPAYCHLEKYYK